MWEFTEYPVPPIIGDALVPIPDGAEIATQEVTIGAESLQSAPFGEGAHLIVGTPSADCRIAFAADPAASNQGTKTRKLTAGIEYCFWVREGERCAVIQASA